MYLEFTRCVVCTWFIYTSICYSLVVDTGCGVGRLIL